MKGFCSSIEIKTSENQALEMVLYIDFNQNHKNSKHVQGFCRSIEIKISKNQPLEIDLYFDFN